MSIIIKTPQPDTEERLVLVPLDAVSRTEGGDALLTIRTANARDATPDDLARGGYVRDGDTRAGLREALRARERAELDALAELDEQRARAEKAEGLLIQHETELRLAREDGDERARDLRQAYERAVAAAEKAERERDEAKAGHNAVQPRVYALEADLADAKAECAGAMLSAHAQYAETVRERDQLRAELARLTAPGEGSEGEPTYEALGEHYRNAWDASEAMLEMGRRHDAYAALYRLGVAHERARQQPEKDRALALAARVRQERCLVAEAVGMGTGVTISRTSERVPSTTGMWDVYVTRRPDVPGEHYAYGVPTADVPATLARLLGEVSRG